MRISDWSSDVCSSDLADRYAVHGDREWQRNVEMGVAAGRQRDAVAETVRDQPQHGQQQGGEVGFAPRPADALFEQRRSERRSEEHTSELQSLMRTSYAVFCLTKKNTQR